MLSPFTNLSPPDTIMLLLAILVLLSWPLALLIGKFIEHSAVQQKLGGLITQRTWLPAVLVCATFSLEILNLISGAGTVYIPTQNQMPLQYVFQVLRSLLSLWLMIRLADALYQWLRYVATEHRPTLQVILPQIKNSLKLSFIALSFVLLVPDFLQTEANAAIISKLNTMLIVWATTWLLIQSVIGFEQITIQRYKELSTENYKGRGIYTKARVFRKVAIGAIIVLAIAASLTLFDSLRQIGAGLLTSAGLATVVVGFAAQKTLGNLFAGLQIAITQPIKINDALIIENEFGTVEEINTTYVVIKLWDLRRMVLPINYFLENPFQNWTRKSETLLGTVFIYADFSLPLEPVREAFMNILKDSKRWDHAVAGLQVSDATAEVMQLRALASAKDASTAWDLRCEVREKLIAFIAKNYPQCLPRVRQENYARFERDARHTELNPVQGSA